MTAHRTPDRLSSREGWIARDVLQDLRAFANRVMHLISIDTMVIRNFLKEQGGTPSQTIRIYSKNIHNLGEMRAQIERFQAPTMQQPEKVLLKCNNYIKLEKDRTFVCHLKQVLYPIQSSKEIVEDEITNT